MKQTVITKKQGLLYIIVMSNTMWKHGTLHSISASEIWEVTTTNKQC